MARQDDKLHNFTAKLVVHVMVDDYVKGIASPVEALYLVNFFAPEQYIDVVFNTGLEIYGIDEIIEGALLGMGMEAVCRRLDGEDAVEMGERLMRVVGVDGRFQLVVPASSIALESAACPLPRMSWARLSASRT